MGDVRLAIIGTGGMAAHHADAFRDLDGCAVVAIAGRNPDTGRKLAKRHDVPLTTNWTEAVQRSDVDAVVVCTHNESHAEIAMAAIRSGKHVLTEYPIARSIEQGDRLREALRESGKVLRVTHEPAFSKAQSAVHDRIAALGDLITAIFVRLTPGRGRRPEVLFNLEVSGPPALFFVGHIYPLIDLFGPAAWVEGAAEYVGLDAQNRYERFANSVTVGFQRGGLAHWIWAGGIQIGEAEELQRIVFTGGTLIRDGQNWKISTADGVGAIDTAGQNEPSVQKQFLLDLNSENRQWLKDTEAAFDAARIGLSAEISARENRRVLIR